VSKLKYDATRWIWEDGRSLLNFPTTKRRKMVAQPKMQLNKNVMEVWPMVIPSSFTMKWVDVWLKAKVKKTTRLM
jgi:hypothetical protein